MTPPALAAEPFTLDVSSWVNGPPAEMDSLRGRVVVIEAFQMLCPGCVSHGLPLAQRIHRTFSRDEVVVLGVHTVFEHHAVMGPEALEVFLSEYRIEFPVAIDRAVRGQAIPATMQRHGLRGTPSMLIVDREGRLRDVGFGAVDELAVGAYLGRLLAEPSTAAVPSPLTPTGSHDASCALDGTCG